MVTATTDPAPGEARPAAVPLRKQIRRLVMQLGPSRMAATILFLIVAILFARLSWQMPLVGDAERALYDARATLMAPHVGQDKRIVMVTYDDETLFNTGIRSPLDRTYLANALAKDLPELPDDKKARLVDVLGLSAYDASVLVSEKPIADYFEKVAAGRDGKLAANWVINDLLGQLNKAGKDIENAPVSPEQLGAVLDLIKEGTISGKIAKDLFEIVWNEGGDPKQIVEKRGMKQVTDTGAIEKAVDEVIAANPDKVEQAKAKPTMAGWFVGQVMKATGGKANPQAVNALVKEKLGIAD